MANSAQARKRAHQNKKRALHNASQKSAVRTLVKKVLNLLNSGKADEAKTEYRNMVKAVDITAGRNVISQNKAARIKSRLNKKLKAAAQG